MHRLHLHLLLLVHLHLLLLLLLVGVLVLIILSFAAIHLLLHLLVHFLLLHLLEAIVSGNSRFFLLFDAHRVRLHVNRDHKGCESVTTDDTTIVHNVLRCDLNVFTIWVSCIPK